MKYEGKKKKFLTDYEIRQMINKLKEDDRKIIFLIRVALVLLAVLLVLFIYWVLYPIVLEGLTFLWNRYFFVSWKIIVK